VSPHEIILIYCSVIHSILEYACAMWHSGLTTTLSNDAETARKRCTHIICHDLSCNDALSASGLVRLSVHHEKITGDLFQKIQQPNHVLHNLLSLRPNLNASTRDNYLYSLPPAKKSLFYCRHNILYTQAVLIHFTFNMLFFFVIVLLLFRFF
jgi:hypothetical protein